MPLAAAEIGEHAVHFVASGRLRLYHLSPAGQEITLALLAPTRCFSLVWLDEHSRANTCVMAIADSTNIVSLTETYFQALVTEHPEVGHATYTHTMQLLADAYERLADHALYDVATRLAHLLGRRAAAEPGPITATHQELAWLAGATRPRVTQALRQLRRRGLIASEPHRRGIQVLDARRLIGIEHVP